MRILVVGGSGLLGREVVVQAERAGASVVATFYGGDPESAGRGEKADETTGWRRLDVRDRAAVAALVASVGPDVVVNAAYQQADWVVTADGAMHVAAAAAKGGARLVHVSSDSVFSGRSGTYDESSVPCPGTVYGAAKAAAETAVKGLDPRAVIARTSLIVGEAGGGRGVVSAIHALAGGTKDGVLFTDDVRCPVHVGDLAAALLELAASESAGVVHLAGRDAVSRYELGLLVARRDGLDGSRLRSGLRAESGLLGAHDVRLEGAPLRGAREFLARGGFPGSSGRPGGS